MPKKDHGLASVRRHLHARLLLVEDEEVVRSFSSRILKHHGYEVLEAATPAEALAIGAEPHRIDLVLSDVVMPGLNGPDLLARLQAQRPVRALFMTGYTDKFLGTEDGAFDVIEKPFGSNELLRRVRQAMERTTS